MADRAPGQAGRDKALTRFYLDTDWDGGEMLLQARAMDETGYVQPTKEAAARGARRELDLSQQLHPDLVGPRDGEAENVEVS